MNDNKESKKPDPEKKDSSPAKQPLQRGADIKAMNLQLSRNSRNAARGQKKPSRQAQMPFRGNSKKR